MPGRHRIDRATITVRVPPLTPKRCPDGITRSRDHGGKCPVALDCSTSIKNPSDRKCVKQFCGLHHVGVKCMTESKFNEGFQVPPVTACGTLSDQTRSKETSPMRKSIQTLLLLRRDWSSERPRAWADDRADARDALPGRREAVQRRATTAARSRSSVRRSSSLPADLNNYNLALCYDKLGEAEPGDPVLPEYLDEGAQHRQARPRSRRASSRLDAAVKSATAKKTDEDRKADDAAQGRRSAQGRGRRARPRRPAASKSRAASPRRRRRATSTRRTPARRTPPPTSVGSSGTPGNGQPVATGDAQLDRVQSIDINAIRDQRGGGAPPTNPSVGNQNPANPNVGAPNGQQNVGQNPGMNPTNPAGPPTANAMAPSGPPNGMQSPNGTPVDTAKPVEQPVYKKWWFWAVVAVSAYVVYEIANDNSQNTNRVGREMPLNGRYGKGSVGPSPGGFTLIRW